MQGGDQHIHHARAPQRPFPRELPPDVHGFTGRAAELTELDDLLASSEAAAPVLISAVSGTAGVGKTAVAIHWAHRVAERFTDGQLYVDLRGYDPDRPLTANEALAGFLRALGVANGDIPFETAERATMFRSLLAGRRVLILLDNAHSTEQVRLLLPGSSSCMVVVTSRDRLTALVSRHGARRIEVDLLPVADAVTLLHKLIGERTDTEPTAAVRLAQQCARLPLALRVAAELAATRPDATLAHLVSELADHQRRLDLLDAGDDPRTAVRAVFSWSYLSLSADARYVFRLIGVHPGPDIDAYASAALTRITLEPVRDHLQVLLRAHLIRPTTPGRYDMHDLLRAYAVDLAMRQETEAERRDALTGLFDYYLAVAAACVDLLYPSEQSRWPEIPRITASVPELYDRHAALAWLDAQRDNLVAASGYGVTNWPAHVTAWSSTLFRYLYVGGYYLEAIDIHTNASRAGNGAGDKAGEARALNNLGLVHARQGRYRHATEHHRLALARYEELGDTVGQANALGNLAGIDFQLGDSAEAAVICERALGLYHHAGDRAGEANAWNNLGMIRARQGRYSESAEHSAKAMHIWAEIGERGGMAHALHNLGSTRARQGRFIEATDHYRQALTLFRETGDRNGTAHALSDLGRAHVEQGRFAAAREELRQAQALFELLGDVVALAGIQNYFGLLCLRQGRFTEAESHFSRALAVFRETGDRTGESEALNGTGEALRALREPERARKQHEAALALAREVGDVYEQARAHDGLARLAHDTDDITGARRHWERAVELFDDLGVPDAAAASARLAALDGQAPGP